jgi:pyruvate formate lyase activating enzyme
MKKTLLFLILSSAIITAALVHYRQWSELTTRWFSSNDLVNEMAVAANSPDAGMQAGPRPAKYWQELSNHRVRCELCPHYCVIPDGSRGRCRVRENRRGELYTIVYGRPVTASSGPIEKAPFHHFFPGHWRQTVATVGCNFRCQNCQNWSISQSNVEDVRSLVRTPRQIVDGVRRAGFNSVSFTYTEPTVFYEYVYDIAKLAQQEGIKTTLVTNGFINPEPLRALLRHIDAVRVDLKAFDEAFYREISSGSLQPVLQTLKIIQEEGVWLEIINLVIPTLNDDPEKIKAMCRWILENLGPDVPLHFNRFMPAYRLTHLPATPVRTLEAAHRIAREAGLNFVTIGNVPGHRYDSTFCPGCGERLIHRAGITMLTNHIRNGQCRFCNRPIPGRW